MANKHKCPECRGRGTIPCPMEYGDDDHPDNCPGCGGDPRAKVSCPECGGSGEVDD
jgi:hypothetical protein